MNRPPRPTALPVTPAHIPEALKFLPQWVTWRYVWKSKEQKWDKPPLKAGTSDPGSSTKAETWSTFPEACKAYQQGGVDGIGFVVTEANALVGVDLDHCRDAEGTIAPWAQTIVDRLRTYTEVSPSGEGLRLWLRGIRQRKGRRHGPVEVYSWGRYLTITGNHLESTPATIEPRQAELEAFEAALTPKPQAKTSAHSAPTNGVGLDLSDDNLLDKAHGAKNGGKFARLFSGEISEYGADDSRADLALCDLLAFWTRDPAKIDRIFRRSKLYREKWERADYRDATIANALAETPEHYTPGRQHHNAPKGDTQEASGATNGEMSDHRAIRLTTDLPAMTNALQEPLLTMPHGPRVFQRARQLCLIGRGIKPPKWLRRPADAPVILPMLPAYLRELASEAAAWEKYDKRAKVWESTLPPLWLIDTLAARPSWPFPPLEGIVSTPTLRPDGTILTTPGYDVDTGLYLDINGTTYPPLPTRPTLDDARTAIGRLQEPFLDFPLTTDGHLSTVLAAVLSLVARYAIQGNVPLFAVRSTTRGAGKGLLIDGVSLIGTGRHAPRWAQTTDHEEERKRLLTIALAGDAALHIDNVTRPLGSPSLDLALTAPTFSDRILGQQVSREAPMQTIFFASGNNMQFQGDMARRVVPIDLDPKTERPEERDDFRHSPLLPWILKERPRLVVCALTVLKAYFVAGQPGQGIKPLGSFEEWSTLIRQALIWAGEADPCASRQDIEAESDPDYEALESLLAAWHAHYQHTPKTVKEVKNDVDNHTTKDDRRWIVSPEWRDLHSALAGLDKRHGEVNSQIIGKALRGWKGRMIGAKRLIMSGQDRSNVKLWAIESR